jgi:glycosyltransferase involved in cell wall biosynthesis
MKKILFITHNTSRTGAPYVLLLLLKWFKKEEKQFQSDVVFLGGGDLKQDFKLVTDNSFDLTDLHKKSFAQKVYSFVLKKITKKDTRKEAFIKKVASQNYDVIYANSIASVTFAVHLKKASANNPKIIAHIHELNTVIKEYLPNFNEYIPHIDHFISVSNLVKQNLETNWNVNTNQNTLVYEFSDKLVSKEELPLKNQTNKVFEVGASGLVHWRKGDDLFIQVANYIKAYHPEIKMKFTWVGQLSDSQKTIIDADLEKANLKETVSFVGEQKHPEDYFKNFDVFLMTSREDPFPLVCIEVGRMGIPIMCFENATGTAEIIQNKGGFVVPYLDCVAMAEKLIHYYSNENLRVEHGNYNKNSFSNFISNDLAPKIQECINNCL